MHNGVAMKVCVTGGSSGIGRALAVSAAEPGGLVVVDYHRDDAAAAETATAVRERGAEAVIAKHDVGDPAGARDLMRDVAAHTDRLDRLVLCAARPAPGPLLEIPAEDLRASAAVNALSIVFVVREALEHDLLRPGSSVVYLTSRGGRRVIRGYGGLGTAKAYAESIVRHLALELAPRGVRINAISPGALDTPAFRRMYPDTWPERLAAQIAANPSGRAMSFDDVVAAVDAACDPALGMLQGQIVQVDGGADLL